MPRRETFVEVAPPPVRRRPRRPLPAELPPRLLQQRVGAPVVELQLAAAEAVIAVAQVLLLQWMVMLPVIGDHVTA